MCARDVNEGWTIAKKERERERERESRVFTLVESKRHSRNDPIVVLAYDSTMGNSKRLEASCKGLKCPGLMFERTRLTQVKHGEVFPGDCQLVAASAREGKT